MQLCLSDQLTEKHLPELYDVQVYTVHPIVCVRAPYMGKSLLAILIMPWLEGHSFK